MNIRLDTLTWMSVMAIAYMAWFFGEVAVAVWQEVRKRKGQPSQCSEESMRPSSEKVSQGEHTHHQRVA